MNTPPVLISVIAFVLVRQPWLGVPALAVVLPQAGIVVAIQSRINRRVRQRVQLLRDGSGRVSDSDLERVEEAAIADFHEIFETRRRTFLAAEQAIFDQVRAEVTAKLDAEDRVPINRYFEGSPVFPGRFARDWATPAASVPAGLSDDDLPSELKLAAAISAPHDGRV